MTLLVAVLLGAGAILIASSLDNTPIASTFQKIIKGEAIDWTGAKNMSKGTDFGGSPLTTPTGSSTKKPKKTLL